MKAYFFTSARTRFSNHQILKEIQVLWGNSSLYDNK